MIKTKNKHNNTVIASQPSLPRNSHCERSEAISSKQRKSLVPKLRFKEFEGEWEQKKLDALVNSISSGKIKPDSEGEFLVYGSTGVIGKSNQFTHEGEYILIARVGANAGRINRASGKFAVTDNTLIIDAKQSVLSNSFIEGFLEKYNLNRLIFGSGQPLITGGLLKGIKVNLPNLPEQQKIAKFLTAVDTKLQQLTTKKEKLEHYKKGVMQQLFSQQLRFKPDVIASEEREKQSVTNQNKTQFPNWEVKRLGDIGEIIGGGTPDTTNSQYWDGDIQWFTPTEVSKKHIDKSKRTISSLGLKKSSARLLPKGTILFTSRATIAELSFAKEKCTTNQGFQSIVVNVNNNSEFVYYWINNNKKEFIRKSQGSTFLEISKNEMKKIKMIIPSLKEQQKIATYLSAIDNKIETVQTQITKTQQFKKGLLQQMFV